MADQPAPEQSKALDPRAAGGVGAPSRDQSVANRAAARRAPRGPRQAAGITLRASRLVCCLRRHSHIVIQGLVPGSHLPAGSGARAGWTRRQAPGCHRSVRCTTLEVEVDAGPAPAPPSPPPPAAPPAPGRAPVEARPPAAAMPPPAPAPPPSSGVGGRGRSHQRSAGNASDGQRRRTDGADRCRHVDRKHGDDSDRAD